MFNFAFGGDPFGGGMGGMGGIPFEGMHRQGGRPARDVDTTALYETLGIAKTADAAEIKKAFRKAAIQHHPDKGGDPDKFKEASKAYEVLSDPEKRKVYDQFGEEGLEQAGGGGGGGASAMDIFGDLFGSGMFGARQRGPRKSEDVVFPLKVTLDELYLSTTKKLRLTKNAICQTCNGKGSASGRETICSSCRGQGVKITVHRIGPGMIQQSQGPCNVCGGSGQVVPEKDRCKKCRGDKLVKEKKTLEVHVQKGSMHGQKITFAGEADEIPDGLPGDVVVVLQQVEHPLFKREGVHLHVKKQITLVEALTGFSFTIRHLDNRLIVVRSDGEVTRPGDYRVLRSHGMPHVKNPFLKGDLFVEFDVEFPRGDQLQAAHRQALVSALPRPQPDLEMPAALQGLQANDENVDEATLEAVDIDSERRRHAAQAREYGDDDMDDDEGPRGHPQASCRQA